MRHSVARHEGAGHRLCRRVLSTRSQGPREQSFRSTTPTLRYGEIGASAAAADARGFRWRRAHASARSPKAKPGPASTAPPSTATGIRTRVSAMRGRRPSPLDDSGAKSAGPEASKARAGPVAQGRRAGRPPCGHAGARPARTPRLRYLRIPHADVAELVDAHGSGPCRGNPVEVRVLSSALAGFSAVRRAIGALPRCDAPSGRPLVGDIASGFSTQQHAA